MIPKDKENFVMGYAANEVAAFAILLDGNETGQLDARLTAEIAARAAADTTLQVNITNETSARSAADTAEAAARAAADTALQSDIDNEEAARIAADTAEAAARAALKFFKTVKGVAATVQDDALDIVGSNGISVSASGKVVTVSGSVLSSAIKKLEAWNNADVNRGRVESWENDVASGSAIAGLYLGTEMAKSDASARLTYWSGMLALLGAEKKGWVAFSDKKMCYVEAGCSVQGWPDMGGNKIGVIYLPDTESMYTVAEVYTNGAISAAKKMDEVGYIPYVLIAEMAVAGKKLVELEGADAVEATARGNADVALQGNINNEASARAAADVALGNRCTVLEYLLTDGDMTEIMG